jgi:hypothetical protein
VDDAYAAHLNALLARGPESRKLLAEVAVLLEDCALLGALDAVHEELGVEALQDLAHVSRADLKDVRGLKPVRRQSSWQTDTREYTQTHSNRNKENFATALLNPFPKRSCKNTRYSNR